MLAGLQRARSGALQPGSDVSAADKPHVSRLRPAQPAWGQGSTPVRMGVRISQRRGPKPQPSLLRGATPAIMHDSARAAARGQRPWPRPGAFPAGAAAARRAPCPLVAPQCHPTCLACCENRKPPSTGSGAGQHASLPSNSLNLRRGWPPPSGVSSALTQPGRSNGYMRQKRRVQEKRACLSRAWQARQHAALP